MKIVFVILHYLAIDETYKSVDSIEKKIDTDMYKIVIVDNASPDKSGALLKEHYKNDDHVEVLLNQENLGFARGNNVGFRCAEKTWNLHVQKYLCQAGNQPYEHQGIGTCCPCKNLPYRYQHILFRASLNRKRNISYNSSPLFFSHSPLSLFPPLSLTLGLLLK